MVNTQRIKVPRIEVAKFCRRHAIRKLAFFAMQDELSKILAHKVDLNTPGFLSPYFREQVMREARVQYVHP